MDTRHAFRALAARTMGADGDRETPEVLDPGEGEERASLLAEGTGGEQPGGGLRQLLRVRRYPLVLLAGPCDAVILFPTKESGVRRAVT